MALVHLIEIARPNGSGRLMIGVRGGVPESSARYEFTDPETGENHQVAFGAKAWQSIEVEELPEDVVLAEKVDEG